jgi:hypothetical protein
MPLMTAAATISGTAVVDSTAVHVAAGSVEEQQRARA